MGGGGKWGFSEPTTSNIYGVLSALSEWSGVKPSDVGIGREEDDVYLIYGHYYAKSLIKAYGDKLEADKIRRKSKK